MSDNYLTTPARVLLEKALAAARTRSSWNDRLEHWEKPASDSEETQIERAADMVRKALAKNRFLLQQDVTVAAQGSYHNNTNVRQGSDMDIRVVHPHLRAEYADGINVQNADAKLGLVTVSPPLTELTQALRRETSAALIQAFGQENVDTTGGKAIRVNALSGSRAPVDVIPAVRYFWVVNGSATGSYSVHEGMTFLTTKGKWIHNFPEQHHDNGITKRGNTRLRFKKIVRSLKRLRDELIDAQQLGPKQVPSFLVECLAYGVEDEYYLVDADDRYDRIRRVLNRLAELLNDAGWRSNATEINGIKYLFRDTQPWKPADAQTFVNAALRRLAA